MGASFQLEFYSWGEIMIAKITLVSMLAAVALARPEAKAEAEADPFFYHHGVVGHVAPTCEHGEEALEVQTCAPRADEACTTADVVSEEITYEKRCKEVVSKTCSPVIVKRSADAEPEADPQFYGHYGYPYAAPITYALPELKTKEIEIPCAEHTTEHCVDVPIVKEVITPVETCHDVTKVDCTPADHNIAKVTCTPGKTTVTDLAATYGLVPAAPAPVEAPAAVDA